MHTGRAKLATERTSSSFWLSFFWDVRCGGCSRRDCRDYPVFFTRRFLLRTLLASLVFAFFSLFIGWLPAVRALITKRPSARSVTDSFCVCCTDGSMHAITVTGLTALSYDAVVVYQYVLLMLTFAAL